MLPLKIFTYAFIINLVLFFISIIFNFRDLAGIINFISFIIAIIIFVFSVDEMPNFEKLKIPQVHNYYKSKMNTYGNLIGLLFVILTFLFFILVYALEVSMSLTSLILWFVSIPISYIITIYIGKTLLKEKLTSYIALLMPNLSKGLILNIVSKFLKMQTLSIEELTSLPGYNNSDLERIAVLYVEYLKLENQKLLGEEVKEINRY